VLQLYTRIPNGVEEVARGRIGSGCDIGCRRHRHEFDYYSYRRINQNKSTQQMLRRRDEGLQGCRRYRVKCNSQTSDYNIINIRTFFYQDLHQLTIVVVFEEYLRKIVWRILNNYTLKIKFKL